MSQRDNRLKVGPSLLVRTANLLYRARRALRESGAELGLIEECYRLQADIESRLEANDRRLADVKPLPQLPALPPVIGYICESCHYQPNLGELEHLGTIRCPACDENALSVVRAST